MATDAHLAKAYWDFEYLSNVVRGSPDVVPNRARKRDDRTLLIDSYSQDERWGVAGALTAARWALLGTAAFRGLFASKLAPDPIIDELIDVIEAARLGVVDDGGDRE